MTDWTPETIPDDELWRLTRRALLTEVPEHHVDMVMTGYDLMDPDALLADLVTTAAEPADLRAVATMPPAHTFKAGDWTIEVEVAEGRISGQIVPPATTVALERAGGYLAGEIDDLGQFDFAIETPGAVRLRFDTVAGTVVTAWFLA